MYDKNRFNCELIQTTTIESITDDKTSNFAFCKGYFILHNVQELVKSGR